MPATLPVGLTFEWQTTEAGNDGGWATIQHRPDLYGAPGRSVARAARRRRVQGQRTASPSAIASMQTDNVTAPFSVNENTPTDTVIAPIPFSLDYDPLGFGGTGVTDGDVVQLTHVISPGQDAGGRFTIVNNQLVVANGGPVAELRGRRHTPANQSHQFVDNQYQIVIDTYTDTIANGGVLMASRQFTVFLNDVEPEFVNTPATGTVVINDAKVAHRLKGSCSR